MVDVGQKAVTSRSARASGRVVMQPATLARIKSRELGKRDVLQVASLAGIMAAKRTSDLIPLCHPLGLDSVTISYSFPDDRTVSLEAEARVTARTGVEMEALIAGSVAALTIYDMCKSIDRELVIERIRLEEKVGGQSGHFLREVWLPPAGSGTSSLFGAGLRPRRLRDHLFGAGLRPRRFRDRQVSSSAIAIPAALRSLLRPTCHITRMAKKFPPAVTIHASTASSRCLPNQLTAINMDANGVTKQSPVAATDCVGPLNPCQNTGELNVCPHLNARQG